MSLRARLTLVAAGAVAVAVIVAAAGMFLAVRQQLLSQTDSALSARASDIHEMGARFRDGPLRVPSRGPADYAPDIVLQLVNGQGQVIGFPDQGGSLPVPAGAAQVASGARGSYFDEATVQGTHLRLLIVPLASGVAVELARPLDEVDTVLNRLSLVLVVVVLGGVLLAAALGLLITRAALRPVHALTTTVEQVTRTRDLSRRVPSGGSDELARLGASFNTMMAALDASLRSQRQLVADASHELRTPLTSLRTNLELLARGQPADANERREMLADITGQLERLSGLVADLIDLARDEETPVNLAQLRLDVLVRRAVDTTADYWPKVRFELHAEPTTVLGDEARVERAVMNLLENAAKWSPPDATVEVSVRASEVAVRDHGPGVAPVDAPHVFDRFWRAPAARSMPGSGLGLAIVREVAESHGGAVTLERPQGPGALFRLRLVPSTTSATALA
ncbi:MAG: sensor histidine kinase [Candidatus Limnocylindria bacterium]